LESPKWEEGDRKIFEKIMANMGAGVSPSVILATWKAEIGRTKVRGQPRQIVQERPSPK
jgi:hypothetical protein